MTHTSLQLNNGLAMPAIGFGVFRASPEDTVSSVQSALTAGYRLIDTAAIYGNERAVGQAIAQSGVSRDEVFLTTKLWISDYGRAEAHRAFELSLRKLQMDYVDLYLLHWPVSNDFASTIESYQVAQELMANGLVRAIGVSNFSQAHIEHLMTRCTVLPAVNQIELHPYFQQAEMRRYHAAHGIVTQAWSPLGGVNIYDATAQRPARQLLDDPVLAGLALRFGKTPAQMVLRWHLQHGISTIPKSVNPTRIAQNAAIFDFSLSEEDMAAVDALETGVRGGHHPDDGSRELFPYVVDAA